MNAETIPLPILAACFHSFGILIGSGVNLLRSLNCLVATVPHLGLREALEHCRDRVEQGSALSEAMRERPDAFPATAIAMVRAGEIGGVMDETVARLAQELDAEQALRDRIALLVAVARMQSDRLGAEVAERVASVRAALEPKRREAAYCRVLGCLLGAGVPFLQALTHAAEELAEPERSRALQVRAEYRERCTATGELSFTAMVHEAGLMSPLVIQLFAVGEETGKLDVLMDRAAELLEHEVVSELNAVLAIP